MRLALVHKGGPVPGHLNQVLLVVIKGRLETQVALPQSLREAGDAAPDKIQSFPVIQTHMTPKRPVWPKGLLLVGDLGGRIGIEGVEGVRTARHLGTA